MDYKRYVEWGKTIKDPSANRRASSPQPLEDPADENLRLGLYAEKESKKSIRIEKCIWLLATEGAFALPARFRSAEETPPKRRRMREERTRAPSTRQEPAHKRSRSTASLFAGHEAMPFFHRRKVITYHVAAGREPAALALETRNQICKIGNKMRRKEGTRLLASSCLRQSSSTFYVDIILR